MVSLSLPSSIVWFLYFFSSSLLKEISFVLWFILFYDFLLFVSLSIVFWCFDL